MRSILLEVLLMSEIFLCNRKVLECGEKPRRICFANSLRSVIAERHFFVETRKIDIVLV